MPETSEMDDFNLMGPAALFVKREGSGYLYFGTYRQPRYSDRLSYSEMELEVPESVKLHRAQKAGKKGKPKWMVQAMKDEKIVSTNEDAEAIEPEDILRAFETVSAGHFHEIRPCFQHVRSAKLNIWCRQIRISLEVCGCIGSTLSALATIGNCTTL